MSAAKAVLEESQVLEGHTDRVWCVAWSPSGRMLASCSGDRSVRIWTQQQSGSDAWSCSAILEEAQTRTIRCCAWSPDGSCLATASFDATTAIWEHQAGTWEQVALLEGHESEVKGVAWAPSGALLATCSRDKSVWIWEALPGHEYECVDVKQGHTQDVKAVAWHPDGDVLASASYDDSIRLWCDAGDEWTCAQTLEGPGIGHESTVWAVAFEPGGARAASASGDGTVRLWRCGREDAEPRWRPAGCLAGCHGRAVFSVDWGIAGLATGAGDNAIRVFVEEAPSDGGAAKAAPAASPASGPKPAGFRLAARAAQAHSASDVNCVRWHPADARLLASAGDDGTVRLWRLHLPGDEGCRAECLRAGAASARAAACADGDTGAAGPSGAQLLAEAEAARASPPAGGAEAEGGAPCDSSTGLAAVEPPDAEPPG